ncbi:MAG TPA: ATP-binding protein [Opitutaceae bacterium]|nr:ATP-binding protein [Opitutaceae bacterium]
MDTDPTVNLLLVDDEPSNLVALEATLESLGQNLVKATSGPEALRQLLDQDFAVILLDVQMPGLTGIELAELIRERERSRHIPIIFLTGTVRGSEMMFKGYSAGAVDYLMKPIEPAVLTAKVSVFIELAQMRKKLECELLERTRAAAEIEKLNRALEERNQDLVTANTDLETFSYSVSHDLNAPLRHISGYVDVLSETARQKLDESEAKRLDQIKKATRKMGALIEDLLSFSRIGRAHMARDEVNMDEIVSEVIADMAPDLAGRKIEWNIQTLPHVLGDRSLLRQVWVNLISNAAKYSRKSDPSRIEITVSNQDGENVFQVKDNGVGFDMKYVDRLFGVFSRLHSEADFEGTGVGLANVKRIVQRHGGRTWATSTPGQGAAFFFSLPSQSQPESSTRASRP